MHDIAEFLAGRDPFSGLDEAELGRLASRTEVEFFPAGRQIVPQGERSQGRIRVIRRGGVELLDRGRPVDLLGEGEMFGHPSVISGEPTRYEARAREDTLCYSLPAEEVIPLLGRPSSLRYLVRSMLARTSPAPGGVEEMPGPEVARQYASDLVRRPPVTCKPETTLRDAARLMGAEQVSSVLVELEGGEFGIVTDSDLRSKVVAGPRSPDDPVSAAMSAPVVGVGADQTGADVMLTMLDHDIRHVPVFWGRGNLLGVIVAVELVAAETRSPFVLRRAIAKANSKEELREVASRLRSTVVTLHRAELAPFHVSDVISAVSDALIRRMIELAIESAGPPPAEFAWITLGSHGRREPMPSSDVDSGMAWRDRPDPDPIATEPGRTLASTRISAYMQEIAADVADCVRVLGWRLDPHGVTASGAFSASSIEDWRHSIESWLKRPSDNRVLIAVSILLDGRVIYGPQGLDVKPLLFEAGDRETLQRWMLRLALAGKPPTGFMHNITLEGSGRHAGTFDIKHGGLLPIVDLARHFALVGTIPANHTLDRLRAATGVGIVDRTEARVLEEAFELFTELRLEHQVAQLEEGREPDDHIDPKDLDPLTRRYLRDAFREVEAVQRSRSAELRAARHPA
ncbi:MAG TPA: putative nucleotidyltransferase substrate binding domain-containing protein [Solirubrobacterales bacterium]|nr:putative nucleotidyltransferase substrate binding domain-containing protein [Solirubrobacterales bacterium]